MDTPVGNLLEFIRKNKPMSGNKDILKKSLYERFWINKFNLDQSIPKDSQFFMGCLYLEHESIESVRTGHCKTYKELLEDFYNLNIYNSFGLNIDEYLNKTPKEIECLNKVALDKLHKEKAMLQQMQNQKDKL